jgi:hypothetical protein
MDDTPITNTINKNKVIEMALSSDAFISVETLIKLCKEHGPILFIQKDNACKDETS